MPRELTQAEVGYLAGMLDGEGSISVLRMAMRRTSGTYTHYAIQVRIANTSRRVIDWISERVGGRIYEQTFITRSRGNRKRAFHWHIGGHGARVFLELVRPYLVIKTRQVEIALAFLALGRSFVPAARAELYEQMRALNRKGIGNETAAGAASVTSQPM